MEISAPKIDEKVCATKSVATGSGQNKSFGMYAGVSTARTAQRDNATSLCAGRGSKHADDNSSPNAQVLRDFVTNTLKEDGNGNWPTSKGDDTKPNDNAKAVATDLVALKKP
ncbi:hypothetical protein P030_02250 [Anaplasma phagocytophilum str. CRT35]|nr:hypothetical protein P030_02250 [Anaplasma phagocytophilum str. CRT35]